MGKSDEETIKYIQALEQELNISSNCAMDVWYLRTRSRHTPELEQQLIELHKSGNHMDWP